MKKIVIEVLPSLPHRGIVDGGLCWFCNAIYRVAETGSPTPEGFSPPRRGDAAGENSFHRLQSLEHRGVPRTPPVNEPRTHATFFPPVLNLTGWKTSRFSRLLRGTLYYFLRLQSRSFSSSRLKKNCLELMQGFGSPFSLTVSGNSNEFALQFCRKIFVSNKVLRKFQVEGS